MGGGGRVVSVREWLSQRPGFESLLWLVIFQPLPNRKITHVVLYSSNQPLLLRLISRAALEASMGQASHLAWLPLIIKFARSTNGRVRPRSSSNEAYVAMGDTQ